MKSEILTIEKFLGLMTQMDEASIPLGGALACANLAGYFPRRLQRIPGLENLGTVLNAQNGFPLSMGVRIDGGDEQLMAVISDGSNVARLWNLTTGAEVTGGASLTDDRTGLLAGVWTAAYYLRRWRFGNGVQAVQTIDSASAKSSIGGSPALPIGSLLKSYFGRLYVSGVASPDDDKVFYTDSLATTFTATNVINTDEIPGPVLGLAINSASTTDQGLTGELVVAKENGLLKLSKDPGTNESLRDIISDVVGCHATRTVVNTPVGLLFMGHKRGRHSVYHLPLGTAGEPVDVGQALETVLNDSANPILNEHKTCAVFHDGMYKLFLNRNGVRIEVWADIEEYIRSQTIVWYGKHTRGAIQSPIIDSSGSLHVFEVSGGAGKRFREYASKAGPYTDISGGLLEADLDMPLNVPPAPDEKIYDAVNIYFAKEANTKGNTINVTRYTEGVALASAETLSIRDSSLSTGLVLTVPITGENGASVAGRTARLKITQPTAARLDILQMDVQYLHHEEPSIKR